MQHSVRRDLFGGAYLLETTPWTDARGLFLETYREGREGIPQFVQGNLSVSKARVVRGLHYQIQKPQGKFMRTLAGATFNVLVDVRKDSPTFGAGTGVYLDSPGLALWVPPGFANGFAALADGTVVYYETSTFYYGGFDRGIYPFDPALDIHWPQHIVGPESEGHAVLSDKDRTAPLLADADLVPLDQWQPPTGDGP